MPSSCRRNIAPFFAVLFLLSSACAQENNPKLFEASPKALLARAAEQPEAKNTDVQVLSDEWTLEYDAQGREHYVHRYTYKCLTTSGAEAWGHSGVEFSPWYQSRPKLRARVVTPDGSEHLLDPKTIAEEPAGKREDSTEIYSDRRVLRAPLPAVVPGAVVEEEIVLDDTAPEFEAGTVHRLSIGHTGARTEHTSVTVIAPASLPLKYAVRLLPDAKVQKSENDGRVEYRFEQGPLDVVEEAEDNLPGDMAERPEIVIAAASSWQAIASAYSRKVDERISGSDVAAALQRASSGGKDQRDVAWKVLQFLHTNVRYTGVEFGEASLIPQTPAEVLKRKYGDCKDSATLYVALMRKAGIPANVALLSTGPGDDTVPDLPGMGWFDHAIVYLPSLDTWVDTTDEYGRLGSLPDDDQGRLALVVSADTTTLKRIPELPMGADQVVETREFFLTERGPARVVETSEVFGPVESSYRSSYGSADKKQTRDTLLDYVKDAYVAEELGSFEHTKDTDLSMPFRLTIEAKKASRGYTYQRDASVWIDVTGLFYWLPSAVRQGPEGKDGKKRKNPFVMPRMRTIEWHYKIHPPAGHKVRGLPRATEEALGPASMSISFQETTNGDVEGTVRFQVTKRTLSVEEYEALRKAIADKRKVDLPVVRFDQAGYAYLDKGKIREALDEFRRLVKLHPNEALHHEQMARALLAAGIGEAARAEAKRAVEAEPKSAEAYKTLGWVSQFDLLGRRLHRGFDRAAADAAYRKSLELDPKEETTHADFAILLEYNDDGERYIDQQRLAEAIKEYQGIKDKLSGMNLGNNLLYALMWAKRFDELRTYAGSLPANSVRNMMLVIATAATDSPKAAIEESTRLTTDNSQSSKNLSDAAEQLIRMRMYPQAAELLSAAAEGSATAAATLARAEMLRKVRRREQMTFEGPEGPVRRYLIASSSSRKPEDLMELFTADAIVDREKTRKELQSTLTKVHMQLEKSGVGIDVLADIGANLFQLHTEGGDDIGYRIRAEAPGTKILTFYAVKEQGRYMLLDTGDDKLDALGRRALALVKSGQLERVAKMLDWAREDMKLGGGEDPLAGQPFARFWTKGQTPDKNSMVTAAAALSGSAGNKEGLEELEQLRAKASTDAERLNIDLALARGYSIAQLPREELAVAERLVQASPKSAAAFTYVTEAYKRLERWDDWQKAAENRLKGQSDDRLAQRSLLLAYGERGNYAEAMKASKALMESGHSEVSDYNLFAWNALLAGQVSDEAIEAARRGVLLSRNQDAGTQHTLACLYAEQGRTSEARELLLAYMDGAGYEEPEDNSWMLFGRLAEQYGVLDAARGAYARVKAPEQKYALASSSYVLAQRRMKAIPQETVAKGN